MLELYFSREGTGKLVSKWAALATKTLKGSSRELNGLILQQKPYRGLIGK